MNSLIQNYRRQRIHRILLDTSLNSLPRKPKRLKPSEVYREIFVGDRMMFSYSYTDFDGDMFFALQPTLSKCRVLKSNYINQKRKEQK